MSIQQTGARRTGARPEDALLAWALAAVDPRAVVDEVIGLREGGAPWLLRLSSGASVVLRVGGAPSRPAFATEVAALELGGRYGLPVPRLLAADLDGAVLPGALAVLTSAVQGTSRLSGPPSATRLRALGALAAAIHSVPAPAVSAELPPRARPISGVDFTALRRAEPARPLLVAAEETVAEVRPPERAPVLVHGDLWQGNTVWDGDTLTGVVDWDMAGVGPAGVDLGSLRCDAAMTAGREGADAVLAGYEAAREGTADDVAYWDVVAALSTPPTMGWFTDAIRDQGRTDLDEPTLLTRRDAFLRDALHRLG